MTLDPSWKQLLDADAISKALSRMSYEILERDRDISKLAIVGIKTAGEHLARRIHARIEDIEKKKIPFGVVDITLYRDDLNISGTKPTLKGTDLPFDVVGSRIVLVDDVLFTGRTIRAALDAIIDFGRPGRVELACLIDRGHKELPIRADYVGKNLPTQRDDLIKVRLTESGHPDSVFLVPSETGKK